MTLYYVWDPVEPEDMLMFNEDEPELAAEAYAEQAYDEGWWDIEVPVEVLVSTGPYEENVRYEVERIVDVTYVATRKDTP